MKNLYEVRGKVTAIFMVSPSFGIMETLISTDNLELVKSFPNSWYAAPNDMNSFYVVGNMPKVGGKRKKVLLHRWIMNPPEGMSVDHINHNTLDNTNENLRVVTYSQNSQNRKGAARNSKSGVRGVSWNKRTNKWLASIKINDKYVSLGNYETIEEADKAVRSARLRHMPYSNEPKTS